MNYTVNVDKLNKALNQKGLSLETFCKENQINYKSLQELLKGNIPDMPLNEVVNLLNAFNFKFNDIFVKN